MNDSGLPNIRAQIVLNEVDYRLRVANIQGKFISDGLSNDQLEYILIEAAVYVGLVVPVKKHSPVPVRPTALNDLVESVHVLGSHEVLGLVDKHRVIGAVSPNFGERNDVDFALADECGEEVSETRRPIGDQHRLALIQVLLCTFRERERLARASSAEDKDP